MTCRKPHIENELTQFISNKPFPCIGAKTALNRENLTINCYGDIQKDDNITDILGDLYHFIDSFDLNTNMYSSFIAIFEDSEELDEQEFETALFNKLQDLHDSDHAISEWDPEVSSNPMHSQFSFSLGGQAFFIIGLNPNSSRKSRQFEYPALVFNLHAQFDYLRSHNKFDAMRDHIRQRDQRYSGTMNPMLASFGESSEVYQYSGRQVEKNWQCPFHVKE
ncbi:guanitoxin biosynthesis heme-dependent pre-guanitoxin N-hydroxylase GntA [Alteromonas ponticola]|uniref:YqcI/YcgG family protein n=1 Tax=Alteromonas ponticola TaxID=2720613 RepID=A0ABX1R247_9ALTE|nr:guanitoxin biosynthesis heme-dependent pre-guanitoxin N-hydroxylase GntA [Alteromonas ponticola]NMH60558.1 YqcI/YcgG family protein [Alteromonas ponticola]